MNKKSTRYLTKRIKDVFVRLETYRKNFPQKNLSGVRLPFELIEIGKSKIIEAIEVSAESIILKLSTFLQHTYSTE